jgi:putative DNA primase/helicase
MKATNLRIHGLDILDCPRGPFAQQSSPSQEVACHRHEAHEAEGPILLRADSIKIEPIHWLWNGWLAAGKFHILGGTPGNGKTTIALKVAATISSGGLWPDQTMASKGKVVIWSSEDGLGDTLAPRLKASGADLSNILFVGDIPHAGSSRDFDPATDMDALLDKLEAHQDLRLLILDPVVTAVAGDSHKNTEVRRGLQPIVRLAEKTGCAVLGITHFSKGTSGRNPVERITGSIAFGALARIVWVAAKSDSSDSQEERVLCRAKSNIGQDSGGFTYELLTTELSEAPRLEASVINWLAPIDGHARDLLAARETESSEAGALQDAISFLTGLLSEGPLPVRAIRREASDAGHSWITIRRASEKLGIESQKDGMRGGWKWHLDRTCSSKDEHAHPF